MPGISAVRAVKKPNGHGIETRVSVVEGRMDALETTIAENRKTAAQENQATHDLLQEVLAGLGKPSDGPSRPASGVYWAIEGVSSRLKPFEQRWEQVKGGIATLAAVGLPIGALLWFLESDRLTRLFHG